VEARVNLIISGGTGSGKTTLLNVASAFIPSRERIITIEDTAELQLKQDHILRLEKRPPNVEGKGEVTIRSLVINALRMRPDRIIVGEARGGEALDMLQAMNTGHDGSMTTIHSNSPRDTLRRIETMVLMAGMELPLKAIREQVASAIDLVIHMERLRDGSRKVVQV
jgi:pilus assembly protein CpaF